MCSTAAQLCEGQMREQIQHLGQMSLCRALASDVRWCSSWLGRVQPQASALRAELGAAMSREGRP